MDIKVIAERLHHMHGQAASLAQDVRGTRLQIRGDGPHRTLADLEHELIEMSRKLADYADRVGTIEIQSS